MVENILIVEDEFIVAFDIKLMVESMNYNVIDTVSSGEDALKIIETTKIDLILMDVVLDGEMNGIDTAIQLRNNSNIPIIYSTAYPDSLTHERIKQTEPFDYLIKPFDYIELKNAITKNLKG